METNEIRDALGRCFADETAQHIRLCIDLATNLAALEDKVEALQAAAAKAKAPATPAKRPSTKAKRDIEMLQDLRGYIADLSTPLPKNAYSLLIVFGRLWEMASGGAQYTPERSVTADIQAISRLLGASDYDTVEQAFNPFFASRDTFTLDRGFSLSEFSRRFPTLLRDVAVAKRRSANPSEMPTQYTMPKA